MKRILLSLLVVVAACIHRPPTPVDPPTPRTVTVTVTDEATGVPVADAVVTIANAPKTAVTNASGLAFVLDVPGAMTESRVTIIRADYFDWSEIRQLPPGVIGLSASITPRPPPPPPIPEKATGEDLLHVLANFCNLPDESGKPQFTPFLLSLTKEQRQVWYERQRAAGSTHFVISPSVSYPGAPWPASDLYASPGAFADIIQEILETPSADGKGFRPIILLDPGDKDPRPRITKLWPPLIAELKARNLEQYTLIVPGWELVTASDWTSADLSFGLELMHQLGITHIWVHLSPTRASGASNPVVPSDPWQGAESGFWKEHGGQYAEGFLYESENIAEDRNPAACDPASGDCWLNRWEDVVPRIGNGMNGWRVIRLVLFETVAWGQWNGRSSPKYARDVATAGKKMCDKYHVKCGFGNGLPWGNQ